MSTPKSLERLAQHAARIGLPVKIDETAQGFRVLVDAHADAGLDEILIGYIKDDLGLGLDDDPAPAPPGWRQLGVIIGMREVED